VWLARYGPACVDVRFRHYARPELNPGIGASMELLPLQVVPRQQFIADREFEKTLPLDQF
jgi:hypothetical protein